MAPEEHRSECPSSPEYIRLEQKPDWASLVVADHDCLTSQGVDASIKTLKRLVCASFDSQNKGQKVMRLNRSEIQLIASLVALLGKEKELREVLRALLEPTRNEPGCRRYDMCSSDQQGRFFAIEAWESRQALDEHMQTPHFKAAAAKFSELLQGPLAVDILDPIGQ